MSEQYFHVPEDLLLEVLAYLPVKSLLRFKCVCKSWFKISKIPAFISKHHSTFNGDDDHCRVLAYCSNHCFKVLSDKTLMPLNEYSGYLGYFPRQGVEILGTHNGIVCLHDPIVEVIVFWNPATRERKDVYDYQASWCRGGEWIYGFCYDFVTNDYMVVLICTIAFPECHVLVFALSTRSWRAIKPFPQGGYSVDYKLRTAKICLNGIFSILAYRPYGIDETQREPRKYFLLTLDMGNGVSKATPVSEDLNFARCEPDLIALGNSIALVKQFKLRGSTIHIEISLLNEYGPRGIWTKLYTIGPLSDIARPLKLLVNDELLLKRCNGELVLYHLKTRELKNFRAGCHPQPIHLIEFKESMVPI